MLKQAVLSSMLLAFSGAAASAATFGEFFDVAGGVPNLAAAQAVIAGGTPTATFISTGIDYPAGVTNEVIDSTTLAAFLGADAASLSGAGGSLLDGSVFRFTGLLNLAPGDQAFAVGSDDGFLLTIDGAEVSSFPGLRPFQTTTVVADPGEGLTPFELIFFENFGFTGVQFTIDGETVAGVQGPAPIPVPPAALLLGSALLGLGAIRRKVRSK